MGREKTIVTGKNGDPAIIRQIIDYLIDEFPDELQIDNIRIFKAEFIKTTQHDTALKSMGLKAPDGIGITLSKWLSGKIKDNSCLIPNKNGAKRLAFFFQKKIPDKIWESEWFRYFSLDEFIDSFEKKQIRAVNKYRIDMGTCHSNLSISDVKKLSEEICGTYIMYRHQLFLSKPIEYKREVIYIKLQDNEIHFRHYNYISNRNSKLEAIPFIGSVLPIDRTITMFGTQWSEGCRASAIIMKRQINNQDARNIKTGIQLSSVIDGDQPHAARFLMFKSKYSDDIKYKEEAEKHAIKLVGHGTDVIDKDFYKCGEESVSKIKHYLINTLGNTEKIEEKTLTVNTEEVTSILKVYNVFEHWNPQVIR